jgi:hypothetical protein
LLRFGEQLAARVHYTAERTQNGTKLNLNDYLKQRVIRFSRDRPAARAGVIPRFLAPVRS